MLQTSMPTRHLLNLGDHQDVQLRLEFLLNDIDRWDVFDQLGKEGITNLSRPEWMYSFLMDLFGIMFCQNYQPDVEFMRSTLYTLFVHSINNGERDEILIVGDAIVQKYKQAKIWIVPINNNNLHWQLLVLLHPGTDHCVELVLDSMNGQYEYWPDNLHHIHDLSCVLLRRVFGNDAREPDLQACHVPRQPNGFDCGPFTLLNIRHVVYDAPRLLAFALDRNRPQEPLQLNWYRPTPEGVNHRRFLCDEYTNLLRQYGYDPTVDV